MLGVRWWGVAPCRGLIGSLGRVCLAVPNPAVVSVRSRAGLEPVEPVEPVELVEPCFARVRGLGASISSLGVCVTVCSGPPEIGFRLLEALRAETGQST